MHSAVHLLVYEIALTNTSTACAALIATIVSAVKVETILVYPMAQLSAGHYLGHHIFGDVHTIFHPKKVTEYFGGDRVFDRHSCLHCNQHPVTVVDIINQLDITVTVSMPYIQAVAQAVVLFDGILEGYVNDAGAVLLVQMPPREPGVAVCLKINLTQFDEVKAVVQSINKTPIVVITIGEF